jgi:hypothetical protein
MSRRLIVALCTAIVCLLVVLLGVRMKGVRDAAKDSVCRGHLTELGVAMHQYHEEYGHLPPAYIANPDGRRMHSWRVLVLEFINPALYRAYNFNEPWDGPNNRLLVGRMPACFACPSDPVAEAKGTTNYVVVVGEETPFPGSRTVALDEIRTDRGSTVLIAEVVGANISWLEPRDLRFAEMSFRPNDRTQPSISSNHPKGPNVCMVDGTTARLDGRPEVVRAMTTIVGSEKAITEKTADR